MACIIEHVIRKRVYTHTSVLTSVLTLNECTSRYFYIEIEISQKLGSTIHNQSELMAHELLRR